MTRHEVLLWTEAREWLDKQTPATQARVTLILNAFADFPKQAGKPIQNPIWWNSQYGMPFRIRLDSVLPGLRCIYYVYDEKGQMIIVKFGTHADNVYEDEAQNLPE